MEEQEMKDVKVSKQCLGVYPWMKFGYCFVSDLRIGESRNFLREEQKKVEAYIKTNLAALSARAKSISRFYKTQGEKNRSHIESLLKSIANGKSIKPVNDIVDSVMIAELRNALLLGVHDLDRIQGNVVLDVAAEGERFLGIGDRSIVTRANEAVLRDDSGIWASYTQGPDARTVVEANTRNVIILGFFTPEISQAIMEEGIQDAAETMTKAAGGRAGEIKIVPA
jgi:DNA/RNA-binding domain of Phe-tRNA-synthetase-like protein